LCETPDMKKLAAVICTIMLISTSSDAQIIKKIGDKIKTKAAERADQKTDAAIDKGLDNLEDATRKKNNDTKQQAKEDKSKTTTPTAGKVASTPGTVATADSALTVYNNYDFVPGDKILFEDNFTGDQDGEFPAHWELVSGQGVLNKVKAEPALFLTEGNYVKVIPRMKVPKYLKDPYTIEFDLYNLKKEDAAAAYGIAILFPFYDAAAGYEQEGKLYISNAETDFGSGASNVHMVKVHTPEVAEAFENRWHHIAIAVKNRQMKVYIDQHRVLVVPDTKESYENVVFAGVGDENAPIIFSNVRIASGGDMNMIGKKFTDAKIVTHGINFDVNKATIKPESMGTLNMIVQLMKDNPDVKFEVGGHTDSDGTDDANQKLSQARAVAVREQLIRMGIDSSRLTAKGYGESKPISDNNTAEGKANNRRVEFVKQ
jgi:OmpA-OmpF porin, OOP family